MSSRGREPDLYGLGVSEKAPEIERLRRDDRRRRRQDNKRESAHCGPQEKWMRGRVRLTSSSAPCPK